MKVGDYVRTKNGLIRKIVEIDKLIYIDKDYISDEPEYHNSLIEEDVIKSSPNIIDLIEVGDYVNDYYVEDITNTGEELVLHIITGSNYFQSPFLYNEDIKSVLTHEQFEAMQYVVGDTNVKD